MEPLVAIAGRHLRPGAVGKWPDRGAAAVPDIFVHTLHRAGAREAILMPVEIDVPRAHEILDRFDALILTGGGDIHPSRYGGQDHPKLWGVQEARDAFDLSLARAAVEREMPFLAVCRGMQALNVALGGTLDPHLPDREGLLPHRKPGPDDDVLHDVRLEPGSRAAIAAGAERLAGASSHHQALEKLGEGLVATGWTDDGLGEVVEHEEGWVVGVQWHPEVTAADDPANQGLFDALTREAVSRRPRRG